MGHRVEFVVLLQFQWVKIALSGHLIAKRCDTANFHQLLQVGCQLLENLMLALYCPHLAQCFVRPLLNLPGQNDRFPYQAQKLIDQSRRYPQHRDCRLSTSRRRNRLSGFSRIAWLSGCEVID